MKKKISIVILALSAFLAFPVLADDWKNAKVRYTNTHDVRDKTEIDILMRSDDFPPFLENKYVDEILQEERKLVAHARYKRVLPPSTYQNCVGYVHAVLWRLPQFSSVSANRFYRNVLRRHGWARRLSYKELQMGDILAFVDQNGKAQHVAVFHHYDSQTGWKVFSKNMSESVFEINLDDIMVNGFSTTEWLDRKYHLEMYRLDTAKIDAQIVYTEERFSESDQKPQCSLQEPDPQDKHGWCMLGRCIKAWENNRLNIRERKAHAEKQAHNYYVSAAFNAGLAHKDCERFRF